MKGSFKGKLKPSDLSNIVEYNSPGSKDKYTKAQKAGVLGGLGVGGAASGALYGAGADLFRDKPEVSTDDIDWGNQLTRSAALGLGTGLTTKGPLPAKAIAALAAVLGDMAVNGLEKKGMTQADYDNRVESTDVKNIENTIITAHNTLVKAFDTDNRVTETKEERDKRWRARRVIQSEQGQQLLIQQLRQGKSLEQIAQEISKATGAPYNKDIIKAGEVSKDFGHQFESEGMYRGVKEHTKSTEYTKDGKKFIVPDNIQIYDNKKALERSGLTNDDGRWVTVNGRKIFIVNKE